MIVECIDNRFVNILHNLPSERTAPKIPIKGELYEVIDEFLAYNRTYLTLFGIPQHWDKKCFREVDIDISDATIEIECEILN
jgi:hypothetical protein